MRNTFALLMALAIVIECSGCAGTPVMPVRNFERCPFEGGSVKTVTVLAAGLGLGPGLWQETGIRIAGDDELFIEANGEWSALGPGLRNSPAGRMGYLTNDVPIIPDAPWGALIGRVGDGSPFLIGVQTYRRVDEGGPLSLAINHSRRLARACWGSIEVTIYHRKASAQTDIAAAVPITSGVNLQSASRIRIVAAGISAYGDSGIPKVEFGASDARAFAAFAQQAGVPAENITTLIGENATRSRIIGAINKLKTATMDKSETAIFYFSGHGAPLVKDGRIYSSVIVPYDASEASLEETGIGLDWMREKLGDLLGTSIIILDACFTGKEGRSVMVRNLRGLVVVPKTADDISPLGANTSWLTATSGDNFANDLPKESHGLFTYYLLKALSGEQGVDTNQDGLITIKEAFAWTKEKVQNVSAKSLGRLQVPELLGSRDTVLTIPVN